MSKLSGNLHNCMRHAEYSLSTTSIISPAKSHTHTKAHTTPASPTTDNAQGLAVGNFPLHSITHSPQIFPRTHRTPLSSVSPFFAFRPLGKCLILMYLDIMRIKHELSCHRRDGLLGTPKNIIFCVTIWTCSVVYYLIKAKSRFKDHGTHSERQHT